jgi:UPF0755 protein
MRDAAVPPAAAAPPPPDPPMEEAPAESVAPGRTLAAVRERPQPPVRVPAARRTPPPRRPRGPRQRAQRPSGGSAGRRVLAIVSFLALVVAIYLGYQVFQPFHGDGAGAVQVTVPSGTDAGDIGKLLTDKGVVASATYFQLHATVTFRRGKLRPGNYTLARDMSYGDAIDALTQGPKAKPAAKTVDVTLPEGPSIREMAPVVDKSGKVKGDYLKAATSRRALRRARTLGLPRRVGTPEGFMFPATYKMVVGSTAAQLVDKQLDAYEDNFAQLDLRYAKRKNLTRYDVLIIASMVEREAQLDRERPLIAAVMYNRLKAGMALGIDATIRYETRNWKRPIRVSELEADTPYNTRKRMGLPPTPIGNPGLASLKAAANPSRRDYLFYVVKPGTCGEHSFASTDAQFAADLRAYDEARARAGGKSPTSC